jgi:phage protein D/phage baseplate assembly protein gpV
MTGPTRAPAPLPATAVTPAVDVTVDGQPVPDELHQRLRSVRVATRLSQPTQCELAFVTWPGAAAGYDWCRLGATLAVRVAGEQAALFEGEVTCVELVHGPDGEAMTRVRAYHRLHRLRKRQQLRVFESVTVADVARTLAGELGCDLIADDPGPRLERVVQHRQRDFDLLVETAGQAGFFIATEGPALRLVTLAGAGEAVRLELGASLLEAKVEINLDRSTQHYTALGWHPQRAEVIEQRATTARSGRRITGDPDPTLAGVDGGLVLVDQPGRGEDEVAGIAQAALDASVGHAVTVEGVADGDARLTAGSRVEVRGLAASVCGIYPVCEAVHTVDATGYRTTFSTRPPRLPPATATAASVTLGRVTAVDDPDRLGRVRVSLPAHGDLDVGWLAVVCPGAGTDKGIVALPDVDDTVLVILPHGVPAEGIVLGGLFGTAPPHDPGVVDGAVRRWSLRTPGGQSIVIDDEGRRVRLEDRAGSFVELAPDLVRLHAATDLVVEAPGRAITVRARSVDFVQAAGRE